ncbi:hypothetical protein Bca4012_019585 [Brassica carinata]
MIPDEGEDIPMDQQEPETENTPVETLMQSYDSVHQTLASLFQYGGHSLSETDQISSKHLSFISLAKIF